ncbi:hypothetical protein PG994_011635 [Apiospora phragmitis]|uniref:PHD-type domain-containing protein n=1 Tax=Apiospora phragmitis TaxID=2905665 RepID=A0ABR1TTC5_9PEZI
MAPTTSTTKPSARTSSRFSSPLHLSSSPSGHNKGVSTEGQRTFMRHWLEPPVEQKPSFAQQGLMRGGVLEGMAPLGTLPKSTMLKKPSASAEGTPAPTVKRIVLKKSTKAATPVEESSATPQPLAAMAGMTAPDVEMALDSLEPAHSSPTQPIFPVTGLDDSDDGDYRPNTSRARRSSMHSHHNKKSTKRHSRPGRKSSARAVSPAPSVHPITDIPEPTPPVGFQPPAALLGREPIDKAFADKVVEAAVDEALHHYRYPTAWALRILYDELGDKEPCFVHMIEDIYHQRADIDTIKEFNKLVRDSKTRGKRDNEACNYFIPPDNRTTPHKPKAAPYHDLLIMDFTPVKQTSQDLDGHINKKAKLELEEQPLAAGTVRSSSRGSGTGSGSGGGSRGRSGSSSKPVSKLNLNGASGLNGAPASSAPATTARVNGITTIQKQSPTKHGSSKHSPSKGKKHRRSSSVSSDSSLSEVPDEPEDYEEFQKRLEDEISRPSTAEPNHAPKLGDLDQPISEEKTKPTSKKAPQPDGSRNTSTQPFHPHDSDMAAAVAIPNGASHQHSHRATTPLKFPSKYGEVSIQDQLTLRKHEAKADTRGLTEEVQLPSFTRRPLDEDPAAEIELAQAPTEQPRSLRTPAANLRATRASRRHNEDAESSPIAPEMDVPSTRGSRAATPSNNLRSNKKQKTGLRVKTSPMKRKGTAAGVPREAPVNSGPSFNDKDRTSSNDDTCYTCGGNGEVICCDGCNYSFHPLCVDPPLHEDDIPHIEDFYCHECQHIFFPSQFTGNRGTFGSLLDNLDKTNSRAFVLPQDIRDYFENVRTGPDGEYEEFPAGKPVKVNKKGYDEPFDFYKVRDADGNPVLCHQCLKGASDSRAIIPCSAPNCGLQFHLECLDPPMTIPPVLRTWQCPCHADRPPLASLAPAHRYRKVKSAPIIEQAYTRGMTNNGFIEIEEDDDESEDGFKSRYDYGRVYRLSEKGIKLDFISAVGKKRSQMRRAKTTTPVAATRLHSVEEQQAALNLSQLAQGTDSIGQLINAMVSEASPDAVALMAQGDATRIANASLSSVDVKALEVMLAQVEALKRNITHTLGSSRGDDASSDPNVPKPNKSNGMGVSMQLDQE